MSRDGSDGECIGNVWYEVGFDVEYVDMSIGGRCDGGLLRV